MKGKKIIGAGAIVGGILGTLYGAYKFFGSENKGEYTTVEENENTSEEASEEASEE